MPTAKIKQDVRVSVGDGIVTIRKANRSQPIVANVLGIDAATDGKPHRIYLDRLVHAQNELWDGRIQVSGAISSILNYT